MRNNKINIRLFIGLCTGCLMLLSCGGKDENILGCLSNAAGLRPPSIEVNLVGEGVVDSLCDAKVELLRDDGFRSDIPFVHELQRDGKTRCNYHQLLGFGTREFEVEVDLNGFQKTVITAEQIKAIEPVPDECGVDKTVVTVTPVASTEVCAEGYSDFLGVCKTPAGCEYPSMQEAISVDYVYQGSIYYLYQCTDNCTNGVSEFPGICEEALP